MSRTLDCLKNQQSKDTNAAAIITTNTIDLSESAPKLAPSQIGQVDECKN